VVPTPALPFVPGLRVALAWSAPVDLDLYLTDPTWETVYFANTPSRTGGHLLRDTRCHEVATDDHVFVEIAGISAALPGHYRVGVDFIDACTAARDPVGFRIIVDYGNQHRETTGTIQLATFQPIVLEFELHPDSHGNLTLAQEGR
jgi:uncharacterized protein YfaP (DUF2135 family)